MTGYRGKPKFTHDASRDRLLWGGQENRTASAMDHALAPFDRATREADHRWGVNGLVSRVSPATAAKYGRTVSMLNEAIAANDADRVAAAAAGCLRGLAAMEAEAAAAGITPPAPAIVRGESGGVKFGILIDDSLAERARDENPGLTIWTMREVGIALQAMQDAAQVKAAFPGAEVVAIRTRKAEPVEQPDDEIPF